jgi:hypothetical protein
VFVVHRVYICSDLNPQSIIQQYVQVESDNNTNPIMSSFSTSIFKNQVHFQDGEHCYLPKISSTMTVQSRMLCFQEGENNEIMHMFAASGAYIKMSLWPPPFMMMGRQGYGAALMKARKTTGRSAGGIKINEPVPKTSTSTTPSDPRRKILIQHSKRYARHKYISFLTIF